jgi:hypothetical protein
VAHPVVAAGTKAAGILFAELDADGSFGDSQSLGIRIHRYEFNAADLFADHAGNSIATAAAAADNTDLGATLYVDSSSHFFLSFFYLIFTTAVCG